MKKQSDYAKAEAHGYNAPAYDVQGYIPDNGHLPLLRFSD